ncbi:MAG: 50S ribosomal protein L6 [Lentisphaeria bacterium]|jgi:large subunit ribosomal protein L6
MSRIGKKPVQFTGGAKVTMTGRKLQAAGPKGSLDYELPPKVEAVLEASQVRLTADLTDPAGRRYLGLARSLLQGMVTGVSEGYKKQLEIQGVGFRGQIQGQKLTLSLGFSHPVIFEIPAGIKVTMSDPTHITVEGVDKQMVGEVAARIRKFHPPDSYKGKGVRYVGEQVTLKEGKTVG